MEREGPRNCFSKILARASTTVNQAVAKSSVGKYFKLEARKSSFTKELRAGIATFFTLAYIISVNASILTDSGGPCTENDCTPAQKTTGPACKFDMNPGYQSCLERTKNDLTVATSLASMIACFAMGSIANLPLALAPGMGANAFFAYNMVGFHGSGAVSYSTGLAVVMLEGCLFLLLSATGLRSKLARLIPRSVRLASAVGIGLFLAFTGLQVHQGMGLVGPSKSTLVTLTACLKTDSATGECLGGTLRSPTFWLGAAGFLITATCLSRQVNGSMMFGIALVTVVSWIRDTSVTIFPNTPLGNSNYKYFKKVVSFHTIKSTAGKITFSHFNSSSVWMYLLTILYVDILDTTGSMHSMAELAGFTNEKGGFEGEYRAFLVDGGSTIIGAALGTTTLTAYIESTAGIREGGRTGLTAITVGFCFFLSLFFTPLLTNVPPWAVGPSLILVGAMMMKLIKEIEWTDMKEGVPAFVTMILMPLSFSIANGIIAGIGVYIAIHMPDYAIRVWRWGVRMKNAKYDSRNQITSLESTDVPATPV
ncbi:hypothetical protein LUZ61_005401 [Rhynchospora tenuis]|uniref:Xanthine/uracil permease n=1 Tax=Rhynchospora tenuis TaxID=198213 RepID=A0AAD6EUJ2_9POAL|nr:hypothetical protein LUZ61_005401 [Rhynchospora tenuis]